MTPYKRAARPRLGLWTQFHAVVSAGQQAFTDSLIQPAIILATIAYGLDANAYQVAAFLVISAVCWAWGRFLVQPAVLLVGSSRPVALAGVILRTGAVVLIGIVGYRLEHIRPQSAIVALLICYAIYQIGSMTSVLTTNGEIATAFAPARRAAFFRWRRLAAMGAAVLGAIVAEEALRQSTTDATPAIEHILMLAAAATVASVWFLVQIPRGNRRDISAIPAPFIDRLGAVLASGPIRRYLAFRVILGLSTAADPFVVLYGMREMGMPLRYAGLALLFFVGLQLVGTAIWPRWLAGHSSLRSIQLALFCRLAFLVLAVSIPTIATSTAYTDRFDSITLAAWCFAGTFGFLGFSTSIHNVANQRYLLDLTARTSPQSAIALTNLVLGIVAFAPLGGAWLSSHYSPEVALATAASLAFVAIVASAMLVESRVRVSSRLGAWGTRAPGNRRARPAS